MDTDLLSPESLFVIFSPPYLYLVFKIILLCCFITRVCFSIHDASRVRDWSGILLERSGKRYSGKPDGASRDALLFKVQSLKLTINSLQLTINN